MKCGLLGRRLGHSYSPAIHHLLGDYEYRLYEVEPDALESFLHNENFDGINVTMPYKEMIIPYLDEMTTVGKTLGAVNTVIRKNGKLIGDNTDYWGFRSMIEKSGLSLEGKKCLILGSGGASKVAQTVLRDHGANVVIISRSGDNHYGNISNHADASIIVNATPVGMYPNTGVSPVNLDLFLNLEGVLDVVYNPARTQLFLDAENRGIVAMNGLWMLISQAMYASIHFTGEQSFRKPISKIYQVLKSQMENIILIGMPGCGKSTVGKLLAEKTGKTFVDTDAQVENLAQKSIPRIFAEDGEGAFRQLENRVLEEYGKQSGLIIATGGGCVTQRQNYPLLHQNGSIFWLKRNVENLPTYGRPLSQATSLTKIYQTRKQMYAAFADYIIDNNESPEDATRAILEIIK